MRVQLQVALLCALLASGCSFDNRVGADGEYAFLPNASTDDLAPYPLQHLLIVEDDAETNRAFVYLFAGELQKAALGLPDLRRIALGYGGFAMAFDPPRSRYLDELVEARGEPLMLTPDGGDPVPLVRLDDTGLGQSGASRWLSSVSSDDYDVRAYFAAIERDGAFPAFAIEDGKTEIAFEPQLEEPELDVTIEDDTLTLDYGKAEHADSLTFDLWQRIAAKKEPHSEVEAAVRTLLPPGGVYGANAALVTDAAGKGCWSADRPLGVRVAQLARHYTSKNDGLATVHVKLDATYLDPEEWTPLLAKPKPADYCKDYE
jgi:hypothetical protein